MQIDLPYLLSQLSINAAATILGGLLLALILFLLSDKLFSLPNLNGIWTFNVEIKQTSYNPYKNMTLTYIALIWQEGNKIYGSGEKVKEITGDTVRNYTGNYRSKINIQGYVTKRYIRKSEIILHYNEIGEQRESSTINILKVINESKMVGDYISTIANSSGISCWIRGNKIFKFDNQG